MEVDDAPMFKVLLIGDEEYNREHVVMSIQDIVPETDATRVSQIFLCRHTDFLMKGAYNSSAVILPCGSSSPRVTA